MKKYMLSIVIAATSAVLLLSCSNNEKDIVGKWEITGKKMGIETSNQRVKKIFESVGSNNSSDEFNGSIFEFSDDKTFRVDGKESGTYSISGDDLDITIKNTSLTGKIKISGSNMTFNMTKEIDKEITDMLSMLGQDVKIKELIYILTFEKKK